MDDYNGLEFIQCACRFTENYTLNNNEGRNVKASGDKDADSPVKEGIPLIDKSIFNVPCSKP